MANIVRTTLRCKDIKPRFALLYFKLIEVHTFSKILIESSLSLFNYSISWKILTFEPFHKSTIKFGVIFSTIPFSINYPLPRRVSRFSRCSKIIFQSFSYGITSNSCDCWANSKGTFFKRCQYFSVCRRMATG